MPEAAVDEDGDFLFGEIEVGASEDFRVAAPAFDAVGAEEFDEDEFGGFVAAGADGAHDLRALGLGECVGHGKKLETPYVVSYNFFLAPNSARVEELAMHDLLRLPSTDPTTVYRWRDGIYGADLLTAALVHLDFFTWLDKHPSNLEGICKGLELKRRPVDVMLTLFTAMGFLDARGGVFHLTPTAKEHLVAGSPWYIGPYYASLKDRPVTKDFVSVLKTDRVANWGSFKDEKAWAKAMEDEKFASQFTAAMDCRGVYLGQAAARRLNLFKRKKLLDIGGGSGIYSCSIIAHHTHMKAAVFEKPPVDAVAKKAIDGRGFSDRVQVIAGDVFKDALPRGFDVHLISNVLHDWDEPEVRKILKASADALEPGGLLVIHDAYINAEKTGPLPVAAYSALLMHSSEGKCYSVREMQVFLDELDFLNFHFETTAADRGIVTATKP